MEDAYTIARKYLKAYFQPMKNFSASLLLALFAHGTHAQNLVPNYSFEDHSLCPSAFNQIELATDWFKSLENNVAPHHVDYIHTCGSGTFQAPDGFWGYQQPATGQALAAISTRSPLATDYRENIHAQLIAPLIPGEIYTVSMRVSHTDLSVGATDNLGIRFSTTTSFPIDNFSHMHATSVVTDNTNWITLTGAVYADSAYAYIGVGNFYTDANTTLVTVCSSCPYVHNEYYIDDICVLPHTKNGDPVYCDIPYSPLGIQVNDHAVDATLNPTLVTDGPLQLGFTTVPSETFVVEVTDLLGRTIIPTQRIQGQRTTINVDDLPNGQYLFVLRLAAGERRSWTFTVVR